MAQKKPTNPEKELLSEIYRNLQMGCENLGSVVSLIDNPHLLREVTSQLEGYAAHSAQTVVQMQEHMVRPQKESMMKTMLARGGIAMNTMFDSSDRHIAKMIARGTRKGADSLEKTVCRMQRYGCEPAVAKFGCRIVQFERTEAARMETFL